MVGGLTDQPRILPPKGDLMGLGLGRLQDCVIMIVLIVIVILITVTRNVVRKSKKW